MPRNACSTCRSRKIKCIAPRPGESCERCMERNIQCSYVFSPGMVTRSPGAPNANELLNSSSASVNNISTSKRKYWSAHPQAGHDIGSGSAAEILREGELVQELLLLYFDNFTDVHFMFDKGPFMRRFMLGEIPKIILYSIMALSVRYSNLPIFGHIPPSHRGEILYREARNHLKNQFDHASLTTTQAYILLSTYHLTFGGARKAWIYLGSASSMCKALQLTEDSLEQDPYQRELSRRLVSTIVLMDCTLSPSLNKTCYFSLSEPTASPCDDDELTMIQNRLPITPQDRPAVGLLGEIMRQAKVFKQVCIYHRQGSSLEQFQPLETQQVNWATSLDESLTYNSTNFGRHKSKKTVREFIYLHLLTNHIGQLIYFPYLHTRDSDPNHSHRSQKVLSCYHHANRITSIIQHAWMNAGLDIHNASVGQILTVSTAVMMHICLVAASREEVEATQRNLTIIHECLTRIKKRCRIFDRVAAHLDSFLEICKRSSSTQTVFDRNKRLIRHILHYGTAYERVSHRDAGQLNPSESSSGSITPPSNAREAHLPATFDPPPDQVDWYAMDDFSSEEAFQNCAWMFTDESLVDLYSMSYDEPTFMAG